jgi:hypothetical protein
VETKPENQSEDTQQDDKKHITAIAEKPPTSSRESKSTRAQHQQEV